MVSLQNLFEATIPQSLIDEREKYLETEMMKKLGVDSFERPRASFHSIKMLASQSV